MKPDATPEIPADVLEFQRCYDAGSLTGYFGGPAPVGGRPGELEGWKRGRARMLAREGRALAIFSTGMRCSKCGNVSAGSRQTCHCWPEGGWDATLNRLAGCRMEAGVIIDPGAADEPPLFMTHDELHEQRRIGATVIDAITGNPI